MTTDTSTPTDELAFSFLRASHLPSKPRTRGITEIRGPYYSVMGPRYLKDVLETMGAHVVEAVRDDSTDDQFELSVEPGADALDTFKHPYAYAA
jgi:(2R)-phospho-3-sulfolactate synthase (ComA)